MLGALLALAAAQVVTTTTASAADSYRRSLQARAVTRDLASTLAWRRLLHYEPRWFGDGLKSTADTPSFFLAADGKTDPQSELVATIDAFFAPPIVETETEQHPQCRFRARFAWLAEKLDFDAARLPHQPCKRFEWWRGRLAADSATVVFAAAYLNNPASMFGHTFLRLNRKRRNRGADLVAYTVNFAADPTTDNALFYALLGIAGGFAGMYSTLPYYLKVKEYTDLEDRDLWEYDLTLRPDELERLVDHLWELGNVSFDYYYFDENCSYHLLSLLEVARPELELTSQFGTYAIPADTLRAVLGVDGLVGARRYRPSRYVVMLHRRSQIGGALADRTVEVADGARSPEDLEDVDVEQRAAILDAALAYFRYHAEDEPSAASKARERSILRARKSLGVPSAPLEIEADNAPDHAHESTYLAMGGGFDDRFAFAAFEGRFALHDLLGHPRGYVRGSQIEFVRTQIRVPVESDRGFEPSLEMLRLLQIVSLSPIDPWAMRVSWRLSTGVERRYDGGCTGSRCLYYGLSGGPGLAFDLLGHVLVYGFVEASADAGPAFADRFRFTAGVRGGAVLTFIDAIRLQAEATWAYALPTDGAAPFGISVALAVNFHPDVELRSGWVRRPDYDGFDAMIRYAF